MLIFKCQLACAWPKSVCCLAPELDEDSWGMAWACLELPALNVLQLSDSIINYSNSIIQIFGSQEAVTLQIVIIGLNLKAFVLYWFWSLGIWDCCKRWVLRSIFIQRGLQSLSLACQLAHGNGMNIQSWVVSAQDNGFFTHPWSEVS